MLPGLLQGTPQGNDAKKRLPEVMGTLKYAAAPAMLQASLSVPLAIPSDDTYAFGLWRAA